MNWLNDSQRRQAENEQSENDWYMRQLGNDPSDIAKRVQAQSESETSESETSESEAMKGNTILGDINYPSPVVVQQPQPQSSISPLAMVLLSLLGGGLPAAGMAGYMLANRQHAAVQPSKTFEDESVSIGLGRLEDYLKPTNGATP